MPTINAAVERNIRRLSGGGAAVTSAPQHPTVVAIPASGGAAPGRTVLPTRGSYPASIVLATDLENAAGYNYGRMRARVIRPPSSALLAGG